MHLNFLKKAGKMEFVDYPIYVSCLLDDENQVKIYIVCNKSQNLGNSII